ncbi:MAG: nuclear transport factor 2 family protein [Phycisphaerales bacterium]
MSENKATVKHYMDGFRASDHAKVLACLTDDVVWDMPGAFHHVGKPAFDKEIENDAFEGRPEITVERMIEENDVVVAEGAVQSRLRGGAPFRAVFCDVFFMREAKIAKLVTYLMVVK